MAFAGILHILIYMIVVSYLGMAVQLYVQTHLGHYHTLTQKEYIAKNTLPRVRYRKMSN